MSMRSLIRGVVETRLPSVASAFRYFREEAHAARAEARQTPYGFVLAADAQTQNGSFEAREVELVRTLMSRADVVVDVGANVGFYTCLARQAAKVVIAVEPLASNLKLLYRNLSTNGWTDVEVWPVGLSNRPGIAELFGARTGASLIPGWSNTSLAFRNFISLTTLDVLLRGRFHGQHLVVKIDVEGAEFELLGGSVETLERTPRPVWLVEITLDLNRPTPNERFTETFEFFLTRGYRAYAGTPDRPPVERADIARWVSAGSVESGCYNWLFVSDEA
jgi:FkbM family methyltransferase